MAYLALSSSPWIESSGGPPFVYIPIRYFVAVVMFVWPQVAFALVGGFLSRRFKVTITPTLIGLASGAYSGFLFPCYSRPLLAKKVRRCPRR